MTSDEVINQYENVIIQIATPHGTGSGFYLKDHNVIVTNRHVIQGSKEVVISGQKFPKAISEVYFSDAVHDLAFIRVPDGVEMPGVRVAENASLRAGDTIIAIGHPYGLKYTATQGIVSKAERLFNNINYVQVDAAINPGNSGGPLINAQGEIVGVNTFIISNGDNLGFALPAINLRDTLNEYAASFGQSAIRCNSCSAIVTKSTVQDGYCGNCGSGVDEKEFDPLPYQPTGVCKTMENIIEKLGKDVRLTRMGPNSWDIEEGSALIKVDYNTNTRFIVGDAHLCKLPKTNIAAVYEYLLRENYDMEGIIFSISNQNIVLSLLVYDEDLNMETGLNLFKNLVTKADHYDNILIEQYACQPLNKE
jgi:serine protease Do